MERGITANNNDGPHPALSPLVRGGKIANSNKKYSNKANTKQASGLVRQPNNDDRLTTRGLSLFFPQRFPSIC